jgi:ubiquitin carboxyl-terminal hydrolase 25/28
MWLDSTYDPAVPLADELLESLAAVKYADASDPSERQKVIDAVRLIAKQRDSALLYAWQPNGNGLFADDELTQAYKYYNIDDRSGFLDMDVLQTMLTMRQDDLEATQAEKDLAKKHFEVLKENAKGISSRPSVADYNSPVGLHNRGNTCYLNSLLQYFYTIKPFRELVTNLDDYRQSLDDATIDTTFGKVGGMSVNVAEVKAAQRFLPELAILFNQMATAPGPEVTPDWKLACLALEPTGLEQPAPRRPTLVSPRPTNVLPATNESDIAQPTPASPSVSVDGSSDVTLIGEPIVLTPESDADDGQKEIVMKDDESSVASTNDADSSTAISSNGNADSMFDEKISPPSRAPPVPPRPTKEVKKDTWQSGAEKAAQQQDVQEVVANVQNKALCAIRANGVDDYGNRNDLIKE